MWRDWQPRCDRHSITVILSVADEVLRFQTRWAKELAAGDPYYNPNFTLRREDFSLRDPDE